MKRIRLTVDEGKLEYGMICQMLSVNELNLNPFDKEHMVFLRQLMQWDGEKIAGFVEIDGEYIAVHHSEFEEV